MNDARDRKRKCCWYTDVGSAKRSAKMDTLQRSNADYYVESSITEKRHERVRQLFDLVGSRRHSVAAKN